MGHITSYYVMSRNSRKSRHVTSCHVISPYVMLCHVMSRNVTSCHVMSRHVLPRHVTSCHITVCHVMSRHVMLRHGTSCHVESLGTVTRPTLHCQLTFSTCNSFELSMTVFVGCPEGCRYHTASAVYDLVISYCKLKLETNFRKLLLKDFSNLQ